MFTEQKIRAGLFYFSLFVFLIGLPFILSFALGYKFDTRKLKFTKTGLISIKTQPAGAGIWLGNKLLNEKTPHTIHELLPGDYSLRIQLEEYYPWVGEASVEAGKVSRLEKIILFPLRPNIKQLNTSNISNYWVDAKKGNIYYLDMYEGIIYKSNLEGESFKEIGRLPGAFHSVSGFKVSADREKLLCFNLHQLIVVYLTPQDGVSYITPLLDLEYKNLRIIEAFWHSDNFHIVLVTDRNIEVMEAKPKGSAVELLKLQSRNSSSYYEEASDTLYFTDFEVASDGKKYENLYKLDFTNKIAALGELIKPRNNGRQ